MKIENKIFRREVLKRVGFTLVEMLVVISIIGILSSVLAGGYINSQRNSRDAARKLNVKSIADALNSYYSDYGRYPADVGTTGINNLIETQGELNDGRGVIYIKKMPKETGKMKQIFYEMSPTNQKSFRLYTNLENKEDGGCYKGSSGTIVEVLNGYEVTSGCIYVVTSSNVGVTGALL